MLKLAIMRHRRAAALIVMGAVVMALASCVVAAAEENVNVVVNRLGGGPTKQKANGQRTGGTETATVIAKGSRRRLARGDSDSDNDTGLPIKDSRIVGGKDAPKGQFPHQVAILTADGYFMCGGSLIWYDMVVCAAHCSMYAGQVAIGRYVSTGGPPDLTANPGEEVINILHKVDHPSYKKQPGNSGDITIYQLASPATSVTPADFVVLNDNPDLPAINEPLVVTGWGATSEGGAAATNLQEVDVLAVTNVQCNGPRAYSGAIATDMLCAGQEGGGKDACQGDSGGPLVIPLGNGVPDQDILVGVVSWGSGCARAGKPGVYARVSHFVKWISDYVDANSATKPVELKLASNTNGAGNPTPPTPADNPTPANNPTPPVPPPSAAPVPPPSAAPVPPPSAAPVPAPSAAPVPAPSAAPVPAPSDAPVPAPVAPPVPPPVAAPVPPPVAPPVPAPVPAPVTVTATEPTGTGGNPCCWVSTGCSSSEAADNCATQQSACISTCAGAWIPDLNTGVNNPVPVPAPPVPGPVTPPVNVAVVVDITIVNGQSYTSRNGITYTASINYSTSQVCEDSVSSFEGQNGNNRDCAWTVANTNVNALAGRCSSYGDTCPVSCGWC
jgi:hypothetical protein